MDIQTLKKLWLERGEELYSYSHFQIKNSNLDEETTQFLVECGLPSSAAPMLSFSEIQKEELLNPNQLFQTNFKDLDQYLTIGSNGSGDPVCFDTKEKNEIIYLNHDNFFEKVFINTTILQFSFCLLKYRDFHMSLIDLKNLDDFTKRKFSDREFQLLQTEFLSIDPKCLDQQSFWKTELDYLLYERDNE